MTVPPAPEMAEAIVELGPLIVRLLAPRLIDVTTSVWTLCNVTTLPLCRGLMSNDVPEAILRSTSSPKVPLSSILIPTMKSAKVTLPWLMLNGPVVVFVLVSVKLAAPSFVIEPTPEMIPL